MKWCLMNNSGIFCYEDSEITFIFEFSWKKFNFNVLCSYTLHHFYSVHMKLQFTTHYSIWSISGDLHLHQKSSYRYFRVSLNTVPRTLVRGLLVRFRPLIVFEISNRQIVFAVVMLWFFDYRWNFHCVYSINIATPSRYVYLLIFSFLHHSFIFTKEKTKQM